MYLMYADESGNTGTDYDNKQQPYFVLASIRVEDLDKKILKKNISNLLSPNIQINPYLFGYSIIYTAFNQTLIKDNKYGIMFCDEMRNISNDLELLYPKLSKNNSNIIEKSFYVDSRKNNFIQIADICALYINKYNCLTKGNIAYNEIKSEHCINMYNKIMALSNEYNKTLKEKTYIEILNSLK